MALQRVTSWWRRITGSDKPGDELDDELRFHLEMEAERNLKSGMDLKDARHAAGRDLGGIEKYKEQCRDQRRSALLQSVWQDIRYGMRTLAKSPGFTALAVLSLATGIGATTALFSVLDAVLLRPLPYKDPDRIVRIWEVPPDRPDQKTGAMVRNFLAWKERNTVFEHMGGLMLDHTINLNTDQNPEVLQGRKFTAGFLETLGVQPALGRSFLPEDYQERRDWPLIISDSLWERHFRRDPNVVGKTLPIEGLKQTIIGVMPRDYQPIGWTKNIDFWGPRVWAPANLEANFRWLPVLAKLRPGVTLEQAQAAMDTIAASLAREDPVNAGWKVKVESLHEALLGRRKPAMMPLVGGVGLVLLIACVNVAALLLGRTSKRQREIAIRLSIGAGRPRIIRQLLTESLLLALAGGVAGVALAYWVFSTVIAMAPATVPRLSEASVDGRVLAFSFAVSLLTGVLFGLAPALTGSRFSSGPGLNLGTRTFGGGPSRQRLRRSLVVGEVAIALVLLTGAGLLINSFLRLSGVDPGFHVNDMLTFRLKVPQKGAMGPGPVRTGQSLIRVFPDVAPRFERILADLRAIPGVRAGAMAGSPPMTGMGYGGALFRIEGQPRSGARGQGPRATYFTVSAGFFQTLRVPVMRGRDFSDSDVHGAEWVAIINDAAARKYWPDGDPIGQWVTFDLQGGEPRRHRIVGVVRSFRYGRMDQPPAPAVYVLHLQQPLIAHSSWWLSQVSRTFLLSLAVPPEQALPAIRDVVGRHTGNQPIFDVQTVEEMQDELFRAPRFAVTLLGAFAAFGLGLAAAGVFGVMSYSVIQRSREIGLRMALGAHRADVIRLILAEGLKVAVTGIVIGLAGATAAARILENRLFEVKPTDPMTFAAVSLLLLSVMLIACYLPVRRATRVEPVEVLRHE